jgi:molecular chaperone DnaK (HSP70)
LGLDGSKPRNVAVYDLGGGTFDVSILRIEDGIFEVLSTHGNTFLGGDDFDRCIMDVWLLDLKMNSDDLTSSELQELRLLAEKAKVELSTKQKFTSQFRAQSIHLNRNQFEACIAALVQSTIQHCEHALKDANFTHADVDEVVLVGGSTKVPLVQASVSKLFSKSTIDNSINPDEVVALGAAIEADVLAGNRTDVLLLDVTPLSLGIETVGGLMDVIIPRNSKVPCKAGRNYTTSVDGQVNLKIAVYQGERDQVSENRKLSEFVLNNLPSMPAGLPKIEIAFMLDADGILKVRAKELRSGVEQSIEVQPQYGLTDAEVEKMLMASMQHAAEDMAYRSLKEATNEAEHLVLNSEKFLNLHSNEITVLENSETKKRITELKAAILNQDKDKILLVHDALNDYTKPFAEIMMDSNIQKALRGKTI